MKKSNYLIIIIIELIIILILIFLWLIPSNLITQYSNNPEIINVISMDSTDSVHNISEGYEDLSYNYIINPEKLSDFSFLGIGITAYGDKINDYVKSLGYNGQQLYIINANQNSSYISVNLKIGDTSNAINVIYDNLTNEFAFTTTSPGISE